MKFRNLILTTMIVILFCVPSFAIQGDVIPADDSVFNIDTAIFTTPAQTVGLQENPTVDIVASLMNDSLNLDSKVDVDILSIGEQNSAPIRAVRNLSTVGTYEELFTILTYDDTNFKPVKETGNLATIKTNYKNDSLALDVESQDQTRFESIDHAANLTGYGRKEAAVQNNQLFGNFN